MTKSAVSKQVARLEAHLGLRLLNRSTRRLSLTEAGTAFLGGCQQMVAEAEQAEQAVSFLAAAPRGTLSLNAPVSFGTRHILPGLAEFLAAYPELRVEVTLNDRVVDLVEEGFDAAVRIRKLEDSALVARRLASSRRVLAAAPDYLRRHSAPGRSGRSGGARLSDLCLSKGGAGVAPGRAGGPAGGEGVGTPAG